MGRHPTWRHPTWRCRSLSTSSANAGRGRTWRGQAGGDSRAEMWHTTQVASALPLASLLPLELEPMALLPSVGTCGAEPLGVTVLGSRTEAGRSRRDSCLAWVEAYPGAKHSLAPSALVAAGLKDPEGKMRSWSCKLVLEGILGLRGTELWACCWSWVQCGVGVSRAGTTELLCPTGRGEGAQLGWVPIWARCSPEGCLQGRGAWQALL